MKTLYFDIDGTVLLEEEWEVKSALARGAFEAAVRRASFERLVCVGNAVRIAHTVKGMGIPYDALGVLLDICRGAFADEAWFRSATTLVDEPENRVASIDLTSDWWYVDDLASHYFRVAGLEEILETHRGGRVFAPDPMGDGEDVLQWLGTTV